MGQGTATGVAMDAGNMLKPALTRGDFRVIGATTIDEYERWICADPALERRFQKVDVRELTAAETMEVLEARRLVLERHHGILLTDDALAAALQLSDKHVHDRMRPDRALDALDEACAHAQATIKYSARAERLIRERRALLREQAGEEPERGRAEKKAERSWANAWGMGGSEESSDRNGGRTNGRSNGHADAEPDDAPTPPDDADDDAIQRMARDGMAALERFGAGLEAFFTDAPSDDLPHVAPKTAPRPAARAADATGARAADPSYSPLPPLASRLAHTEAELRQLLAAEGAVVRGVDVARVIAVATGQRVVWAA
jgi:ATP-dependent Clp protease ATP-binding subunit ClpA